MKLYADLPAHRRRRLLGLLAAGRRPAAARVGPQRQEEVDAAGIAERGAGRSGDFVLSLRPSVSVSRQAAAELGLPRQPQGVTVPAAGDDRGQEVVDGGAGWRQRRDVRRHLIRQPGPDRQPGR